MATQSEKIQKLQDEIKSYKETLIKYGDMFNADGVIEEHEQKKLDQMQSIIQKVEKKLVALKEKAEKKEQDNKGIGDSKDKKPFTVAATGGRKILTPTKPNGGTIYFFFGYTGSKKDKEMRSKETENLADDVIDAALKGFKVVYDEAGTEKDFKDAIYDSTTAGIYWSGHGYPNGDIQSSDGKQISPSALDPKKVSKKIKFLILATCNSAVGQKAWKRLIGGKAAFEGWINTTNTSETNDFTSESLFDDFSSHNGTNPNKELDDYIDDAANQTKNDVKSKPKTETTKQPITKKKEGDKSVTTAINYRHSVELIAQPTNMSCWAAGTAMMVSWKNSMSIDPNTIADALGYQAQMAQDTGGLHPEDTKVFKKWGLSWEPPICYTVQGFADLVAGGPIWIAAKVGGPHVRVVTGISGDGTATGTTVYINDPWPVGSGASYTRTYAQLAAEMEGLGSDELSFAKPIYVATI